MKNILVRVFWITTIFVVSLAAVGSAYYLISTLRYNMNSPIGTDILKQLYLLSAVISITYTWVIVIMLHTRFRKK